MKKKNKDNESTEVPENDNEQNGPPEMHPRLRSQTNKGSNVAIPEDFHAMYDRGFRSSRGLESVSAPKSAENIGGLDVTYDQTTDLPNFIVNRQPPGVMESAPASPDEAVMSFISDNSGMWNFAAEDLETIKVVSVSEPAGTQGGGLEGVEAESDFSVKSLKTVNLVQRIDGKEVFNSDVTAALNPANEVISISGQFFPGAGENARKRSETSGLEAAVNASSKEEAIARALFDLTNTPYTADDLTSDVEAGSGEGADSVYEYFRLASAGNEPDTRIQLERPVRVKEIVFPLSEGEFVPAYYMEIWLRGYPAFSYIMDAIDTPDILYRKNLTSHIAFSYRVHNTNDTVLRPHDGPAPGTPHPTGVPDGFQAHVVQEEMITVESLLPGDPWLPEGATTTDGNNCIAYADLKPPDGFGPGDVMGKVSSDGTFDYTYDHTKSSADPNNLQNSLVGMFFHVNWLHDRWYEAGFDEASGNAQKNNFGRGGLGSDPILAEGNDFQGSDNANMSTPADGASPIMQMFRFDGPNPKPSRTSNHEALITFHEMGHYITNRLVGNANGLTNTQGRAMGEGWGDFFAICMTSQSTDDFAGGVFAVGGWTDLTSNFEENYYFSIRRYPYSADMNKNPLTFKHISSNVVLPPGPVINPGGTGPNNEFHNAGEFWCCVLWEVFVNLVAKHGHEAAERRMLAYVIGGLKLTPPRPTFTAARDGILTAVSTMGPGDLPEVRAGFAKRGMGAGAVSPPSNSNTLSGVQESFVP